MIKNVVFDIGKVLVSFDWEDFLKKNHIEGESYNLIAENIFNDVWIKLDGCACDEAQTRWCFCEAVPEYKEAVHKICDNIRNISAPFDYSYEWLKSIKDRGYKVYLLSNFGKFQFEALSDKYTFLELADGKVISYEICEVKPDAGIYEHLFDKYNLIPEESVFIDDREENIEAGVRLGMSGIVFNDYETVRKELDRLLD